MSQLFDPQRTGLLVVDVQTRLWPSIHDRDEVGRRVGQAVDVFGRLGLPILVTEQYVKGLGPTLPALEEQLRRYDAYHPVEKVAFSCLGEPRFVERLNALKLETLVVCGIEGHVCVLQTALEALDHGLRVLYLAEAVGSRNPRHKDEAIARVRAAGAVVGSVEMLAFELLRASNDPRFREVQKVIV